MLGAAHDLHATKQEEAEAPLGAHVPKDTAVHAPLWGRAKCTCSSQKPHWVSAVLQVESFSPRACWEALPAVLQQQKAT